jgi:hypothetical protein
MPQKATETRSNQLNADERYAEKWYDFQCFARRVASLGAGGREFESRCPDQTKSIT